MLVREDLFTPTIAPMPAPAKPPWPAPSTLYPAAFGGAVAAAAILVLNGGRLGIRAGHRLVVVGVAVAALVCRLWLLRSGLGLTGIYSISVAAEGIGVYLVAAPVHRRAFRSYQLRADAPTASLVVPGLVAVVSGWLLEAVLAVFVLGSA